jgi:DDE superfamily endonuclease
MAQDEGRFGRMSTPTRCWAPPGMRPEVPSQQVREDTSVYAVVAPQQGLMTSLVLPRADTAMMNLFLEHVSLTFADFFLVIQVDQAAWHRSKALIIPENIRLLSQPAYSPQVNPAEHIWEELREKYLPNRLFSSLERLIEQLCIGLNELSADKERLQSMTCFPHFRIEV